MKVHRTMEGYWQLRSESGEIHAQLSDAFLQHEMNRTGAGEEATLRSLFPHAIRLQDTLDALVADESTDPWWRW